MSGVRVLVFAEIKDGDREAFEQAFAGVAQRMKGTPGHVRDELLRDVRDPRSYVVAGEWSSREEFQTWFDDPSHPDTTTPMRPYWEDTARYGVWDIAVKVTRDGDG
jgi:heme-degrading monooxygenase HmoA